MHWEILDYRYTTGGGKSSSTHNLSIVSARIDCAMPRMVLRPERWSDKIAAFFGSRDLTCEHEAFNRVYHISGDDPSAAQALLSRELVDFILAEPRFTWILMDRLIILLSDFRLDHDEVRAAMQRVDGFVGLAGR